MAAQFPPPLVVGARVWTQHGYPDHGPLEGPKVSVSPRQGGVVTAAEQPYQTMDFLLYTVRWDNGQVSKHYYKELFCIGRFQNRKDFEAAIRFIGEIHVTQGPQGGFRHAEMQVEYDGTLVSGRFDQEDRSTWLDFFEPLAKRQKIPIRITKLPSARRRPT